MIFDLRLYQGTTLKDQGLFKLTTCTEIAVGLSCLNSKAAAAPSILHLPSIRESWIEGAPPSAWVTELLASS